MEKAEKKLERIRKILTVICTVTDFRKVQPYALKSIRDDLVRCLAIILGDKKAIDKLVGTECQNIFADISINLENRLYHEISERIIEKIDHQDFIVNLFTELEKYLPDYMSEKLVETIVDNNPYGTMSNLIDVLIDKLIKEISKKSLEIIQNKLKKS